MRCVENSAGSLSLRPVAMTGIVTPLIVSVPLCRGSAAVLKLAWVAETSSPSTLLARFRQNMNALIRDEYGSQAPCPCCHSRGARPCCEKNYTSRPTLQHLSQAGFLHFSLRTNSTARLCGKALRQDFDSSFESRARVWPRTARRAKKIKIAGLQLSPWHRAFSGPAKLCAVSR